MKSKIVSNKGLEGILAQRFDTPLYTSDQSIDRVLNAGLPVMLVSADSSTASSLESALRSIASSEAGNLLVVQINPKDSPQTAARFNLHAVPSVATIKNGQVLSQAQMISAADIESHARYLLGKGPRPVSHPPRSQTSPAASSPPPRSTYTQAGGSGAAQNGQPLVITDATFDQEVLRSPLPVVVDFWAPWCGPCRMVAPVLDKLAREWQGKVKIAKINVDENPQVAGRYNVRSIPTMLVVKNGRIVDQWAGALPEPAMRSRLERSV